MALKPESMVGYLKRGDAHRRRRDPEAAATDLEKAQTLNPTEPRVLELLGDVATARQQHDRAAGYYGAYIGLDDRPRVLYKLGLARHLAGQQKEAVDALRQAVGSTAGLPRRTTCSGCVFAMRALQGAQAAFDRRRRRLAQPAGRARTACRGPWPARPAPGTDQTTRRAPPCGSEPRAAGRAGRRLRGCRPGDPGDPRSRGRRLDLYPNYPGTYLASGRSGSTSRPPAAIASRSARPSKRCSRRYRWRRRARRYAARPRATDGGDPSAPSARCARRRKRCPRNPPRFSTSPMRRTGPATSRWRAARCSTIRRSREQRAGFPRARRAGAMAIRRRAGPGRR